MDVLVVGAGATGAVYAHHLQKGGARVAFLVRPRRAPEVEAGLRLYRHRLLGGLDALDARGTPALTSFEEVGARRWDAALITTSSVALRDAAWLEGLAGATGTARLVQIQPGVGDLERVERAVGFSDRVVPAMVGFLSYAAPLPGQRSIDPGIAWWRPPGMRSLFGPAAPDLARALARGGLAAGVAADVPAERAIGAAFLDTLVAGLEREGWSLPALLASPRLRDVLTAAREAVGVAAARFDRSAPAFASWLRPWMLRLLVPIASRFAPVDLGAFFAAHFDKVKDQTRLSLSGLVEEAEKRSGRADALRALLGSLPVLAGDRANACPLEPLAAGASS